MGNLIEYDVKAKKKVEKDVPLKQEKEPETVLVDIQDIIKLVKYAKEQGWI